MPRRKTPRWERLTLDVPDAGPVVGDIGAAPADLVGRGCPDGRTWPTLDDALAALEATGWRIAVATRQPAAVRYTLRRERP